MLCFVRILVRMATVDAGKMQGSSAHSSAECAIQQSMHGSQQKATRHDGRSSKQAQRPDDHSRGGSPSMAPAAPGCVVITVVVILKLFGLASV